MLLNLCIPTPPDCKHIESTHSWFKYPTASATWQISNILLSAGRDYSARSGPFPASVEGWASSCWPAPLNRRKNFQWWSSSWWWWWWPILDPKRKSPTGKIISGLFNQNPNRAMAFQEIYFPSRLGSKGKKRQKTKTYPLDSGLHVPFQDVPLFPSLWTHSCRLLSWKARENFPLVPRVPRTVTWYVLDPLLRSPWNRPSLFADDRNDGGRRPRLGGRGLTFWFSFQRWYLILVQSLRSKVFWFESCSSGLAVSTV